MDYQCDVVKLGGNCVECKNFLWESDKCRGNFPMTTVRKMLHLKYNPPQFESNEGLLYLIFDHKGLIKK